MEEAMPRVWKWNIKAWLQYRCCFSFSAVGLVVMIMLMSKMFLILLYWSWVVTMRQVAAMAAAPKVAAWSWTYLADEHTHWWEQGWQGRFMFDLGESESVCFELLLEWESETVSDKDVVRSPLALAWSPWSTLNGHKSKNISSSMTPNYSCANL